MLTLRQQAPAMRMQQRHFERRRVQQTVFCRQLAVQAVRSLYQELTLYPKPGLVSLVDNGSHEDMNASIFMQSLFALRHYFRAIAQAAMAGASFGELKALGIAAETRMLHATGGINTHRGAIFCLGMLCAAIAACQAQHIALTAPAIRAVLLIEWGADLAAHTAPEAHACGSHGLRATAQHALGGAREEAAQGFPALFEIALPQLHSTLAAGRDWQCAKVDALFALMAHLSDTNVLHRGGKAGATLVRTHSQAFLAAGGTADAGWLAKARQTHDCFVQQRLSPGGAADLLAATCLLHAVCQVQA